MSASRRRDLLSVYGALEERYGPQHWWPGDSPFEVMVGAVLTQNTAWTNVEKAIANLKAADCLAPEAIARMPASRLARMIKSSGYFNVKAKRLQNFCRWYANAGGRRRLAKRNTQSLRHELLTVNGVGRETADDILLYAFGRPVFVIDAYTRRLFSRLGLFESGMGYEEMRAGFESALPEDAALFNEYHALIVKHAKDICRKRPRCEACCLRPRCPSAETEVR